MDTVIFDGAGEQRNLGYLILSQALTLRSKILQNYPGKVSRRTDLSRNNPREKGDNTKKN